MENADALGLSRHLSLQTSFLHSVFNGKVLAEYDGLTKALHYKYMYAGDQRIAMRDGVNRLHYYLHDHLRSARVVIDSAETIKDKYHYLAFGSPFDQTTSTGQPNNYTGRPYPGFQPA